MQTYVTTSIPGLNDPQLQGSLRIDVRGSGSEPLTAAIAARIAQELARMQGILGDHANSLEFLAMKQWNELHS